MDQVLPSSNIMLCTRLKRCSHLCSILILSNFSKLAYHTREKNVSHINICNFKCNVNFVRNIIHLTQYKKLMNAFMLLIRSFGGPI